MTPGKMAAGLITAGALAGAAALVMRSTDPDVAPRPQLPVSDLAPPRPTPVNTEAVGPAADRLGARMLADDAVGNDVLFLIAAALRARCLPARAHDLPRMAVLARLPVLAAGESDGARSADVQREVGDTVAALVHRAACGRPLALRIGPYRHTLDIAAYARAFPESYFDPSATQPPMEARGATLEERVGDPCMAVAYATLPLDAPRAWQCAALRGNARATVLRLCHTEGTSPDRAAADIHRVVGALPPTCQ